MLRAISDSSQKSTVSTLRYGIPLGLRGIIDLPSVPNNQHEKLNSRQQQYNYYQVLLKSHSLSGNYNYSLIKYLQLVQGRSYWASSIIRQAPQPAESDENEVDAQKCDTILQTYDRERSRYRQIKYPSSIITFEKRLQMIRNGTWNAIKVTVQFLVSIPGRTIRTLTMSPKEWSEWLGGMWKTIKHEAHHYWTGTKLLAYEVRVASKYVYKSLKGKELTRRERKQLTRTVADLFRMVPFVVFVAIPFMEFLLPVALALFPNMLPSTFEDKLKQQERLKKRLAAKIEIARFLQETVEEMAKDIEARRDDSMSKAATELIIFLNRIRAGENVGNEEIVRFAKLFNDELTLDNLDRIYLVSMCQYLGINPFGTDAFLRMQLRYKLRELKDDDQAIAKEGLDTLTDDELRQACRARGMRAAYGEGATNFMRKQMEEWLDLSLYHSLPSSLLILSRAFMLTTRKPPSETQAYDSLKETMASLPEDVIEDVQIEKGAAWDNQMRLDALAREEELIKEEGELEEPEFQPTSMAQAAARTAAAAVVREATAGALMDVIQSQQIDGESEEERALRQVQDRKKRTGKILSAIVLLASASGVTNERKEFMKLVQKEIEAINKKLDLKGESSALQFCSEGVRVARPMSDDEDLTSDVRRAEQLSNRVDGIIHRIEQELDQTDSVIGEKLHMIDLDGDGIITREELQTALGLLKEQLTQQEMEDCLQVIGNRGPISVQTLQQLAEDGHQVQSLTDDLLKMTKLESRP
eukprot:TRINITY_DN677_c0_g1_i1.p1 TRINITY_DN677_c0_g1~~TRINITY_DN677_c0_g1_i1.p1  ORF type:complete len:754 (-),score=86.80 TRINITY_DN677_c0_g1_i1:226-2487(-)